MDITVQAEVVLREAGYDTWSPGGSTFKLVCFESAALIGFLHVFESVDELLSKWESAQNEVFAKSASTLRAAGQKAWTVYSIFLTAEQAPTKTRQVERIEEDFSLARKIARTGVCTTDDLLNALLPLMPVRSQPSLEEAGFEERLRKRLTDVSPRALTAFLGEATVDDVAGILGEPL